LEVRHKIAGGKVHRVSVKDISDGILKRLSRETTSGRFIPELDGLRFVAIAMVILYHLNGYLIAKTTFYERGGSLDWLCQAALVGNHGVELFFVISGFILALPFAAHHLKQAPAVSLRAYYLRRLTRLEPPYFATIFLLMLLRAVMTRTLAWPNAHVLASLLYMHNIVYAAPSTALGVAWSLEIEVQFYVLVPILTLVFAVRDSRVRRAVLAGAIVLCLSLQTIVFGGHAHPRLHLSIVNYLQFFLLGFLLADLFLTDSARLQKRTFLWDGVTLCGWPLLFYALQFPNLAHWSFPVFLFVLYCATFRGVLSNRLISRPWITAIGGMCYSIYLIHYEVISAVGRVTKRFGEQLPNPAYLALQFVLVGAAIVLVCGTYFVLLEKPCMRRDWPERVWDWMTERLQSRDRKPEAAEAA
jgi:peptidoglycan/LPS O-acetylase OafA/YrhL